MSSAIDTTKPAAGTPTTQSVRDNFSAAKAEIEALQGGSGLSDNAVTNPKLRDSGPLSVIGRASNSSGDPADIAAANDGEVLRRSGSSVGFGTAATAGIADGAVTYAKIQDVSATDRLLGRDTAGAGDTEELTVGGGLEFTGSGGIQIANLGVINAKLANTYIHDLTAVTAAPADCVPLADASDGNNKKKALVSDLTLASLIIACSDETTALSTGAAKVTFRMPFAFTLTGIRGSLGTAQSSGSIFTADVNENGATILSTKITIDNGEKTSTTAATAPVLSDTALADDAEIAIDVDQIGDGTAKGLKVALIGYRP